jgi:riboflavin biosynthesis pyrimidine reductase
MKRQLPFVSINVAMTADGKLAPATRHFIPFTTKRDQDLMLELRAEFDAVMSGAATFGG